MYNYLTNLSLHLNYDYTILLHLPKLPGYFCRKIMTDEKKCVRFRPVYDILLLREVVAKQPDGKVSWDEVVVNVNNAIAEQQPGQSVTLRACKARLRTPMDAHRKDEMASLRA